MLVLFPFLGAGASAEIVPQVLPYLPTPIDKRVGEEERKPEQQRNGNGKALHLQLYIPCPPRPGQGDRDPSSLFRRLGSLLSLVDLIQRRSDLFFAFSLVL